MTVTWEWRRTPGSGNNREKRTARRGRGGTARALRRPSVVAATIAGRSPGGSDEGSALATHAMTPWAARDVRVAHDSVKRGASSRARRPLPHHHHTQTDTAAAQSRVFPRPRRDTADAGGREATATPIFGTPLCSEGGRAWQHRCRGRPPETQSGPQAGSTAAGKEWWAGGRMGAQIRARLPARATHTSAAGLRAAPRRWDGAGWTTHTRAPRGRLSDTHPHAHK